VRLKAHPFLLAGKPLRALCHTGYKRKILPYLEKGLMNETECDMIMLSENDYIKGQFFNKINKKVRK
jgi:hypothetical protein